MNCIFTVKLDFLKNGSLFLNTLAITGAKKAQIRKNTLR